MLDDLKTWGDAKSYVGFDDPAASRASVEYAENNHTNFNSNTSFHKLSQPSLFVIPSKRGGPTRCALRAFVYVLPRGPHGEPIHTGGCHVVEIGSSPGTSPTLLRT